MKIAINLLPFREKLAGAGKYAKKIVQELAELDSINDYYLFVSDKGRINFDIKKSNFHFITPKFNPDDILSRILWEQLIFPFKLKKLNPTIVFTPSVAIPVVSSQNFYTSIHDIAYKKNVKKYPFLRRAYLKIITSVAAKKSICIFALTKAAKNEIKKEFNISDSKICVTYVGVENIFFLEFNEDQKNKFRQKFNLMNDYILYVGAIEPGKNLDQLFIAFSRIVDSNPKIKLALTSGIGWNQGELESLIDSLKIREHLIFLPYINEMELPMLYQCARMLTYLSSYEGFGMPVLEAMAAGTPVISSKSEAINEFASKAIESINPANINEVVSSINDLLSNSTIRNDLSKNGKEIAKKFTWKSSAETILREFNKLNYLNKKPNY